MDPTLSNMEFRCCGFAELAESKYDVVFAANLYQVLPKQERAEFREVLVGLLKPKGLIFLNNLSTNDPEEYGKGKPCKDDDNSFINNKYLHFCTKEELQEDFSFLNSKKLYEHEYDEPRAEGKDHHHISWIVIGEYTGN